MEVEAMIRPVVEAAGLELVDVNFVREQGRHVLRVTIDRDGGIDLDTIADASGRISRRLDLEGFQPGPYTLEVSSPGVERPLKQPKDFARRVGERVRVKLASPSQGARTVVGSIVAAEDDAVRIATEGGERRVPYAEITSARTVFEWGGGA
jgi:ribosome maturation factor RimP